MGKFEKIVVAAMLCFFVVASAAISFLLGKNLAASNDVAGAVRISSLVQSSLTADLVTASFATSTWDSVNIGASTRGTGAFTTIAANGAATLTSTLGVTGLSTFGSVSSTALTVWDGLQIGRTATTSISGSTTSTFADNIGINKSTTSTVQLGGTYGGCLVLGTGKPENVIYVFPLIGEGGIYLATSTKAADCY